MTKSADENDQVAGALCLGEYGKVKDLSAEAQVLPTVQRLFKSPSDDVRTAAALLLGGAVIGKPDFFSEKLFGLLQDAQGGEKQYFLDALRAVILADQGCL